MENPSPSVGPKLNWTQVCDRLSQTLLALQRQTGGQKMHKVFISSTVTLSFGHCPQTHRSPLSYPGFSHVFLPTLTTTKLDRASATHLPEFPILHLFLAWHSL